jgi:nucleotide-binding universal stress UspA family protein
MLPEIKTILYATGLGQGAPYVFRYALTLARQHQAKIVIVHAVEPLTPFGQSLIEQYIAHDLSVEMHRQARQSVKDALNDKLAKLCAAECPSAKECQLIVSSIQVIDGYPAQVILNVAKECAADLIVMGAHSHSAVGEVMVGSTTRKVLHSADQPVLVVKIPKSGTEKNK